MILTKKQVEHQRALALKGRDPGNDVVILDILDTIDAHAEDAARLAEALNALMADPSGCPACRSGKLIRRYNGQLAEHWDDCEWVAAFDAAAAHGKLAEEA